MFNNAIYFAINLMFCACLAYTYVNDNEDPLENVFQFGVKINNLEPKSSLSIPDAEDPIKTAQSLDSNTELDNVDGRRRHKSKHAKQALRIRNPFSIPSKIKFKKINSSDTTNYPYMAAIIIYGRLWCAGAIVDDNWIVTAAHCLNYVLNLSPMKTLKQFVKVRVGSNQAHEGGKVVDVVGAIRHPKFEEEPVPHADVALLKLAEHLKFDPTVNLIKIYDGMKQPYAQSFIVVSGWGASGSGIAAFNEHSQELLSARLKVRSQHYCIDAYQLVNGFQFTDDFFCASLRNGTRDACLFDAGAPAVQENSLMGIMSFGPEKCGHEYQPAVFTKAFYFRDFVKQTIISYKTTGELIDAMHEVDPIIMRPLQVVTRQEITAPSLLPGGIGVKVERAGEMFTQPDYRHD